MYKSVLGQCAQKLLVRVSAASVHIRHCSSNIKLSQSQLFKQHRLEKLNNIVKYPHTFNATSDLKQFRDRFSYLDNNQTSDENITLCGMISSSRDYGKKLKFIDIERNGVSVQLKFLKSNFASEAEFTQVTEMLSTGDKIGR